MNNKKLLRGIFFLAIGVALIAWSPKPAMADIIWSSDIRLTNALGASRDPSIAVDPSGNVHIAWFDFRDGNWEIHYTKLDNNGNTLVGDTGLTNAVGDSSPSIATDSSGNVHIAWHDTRDGNTEIYYTKLDNNGNTLVGDTRLTDDSGQSDGASIAVYSYNDIHIA
ncbi:MAG: hypothetical protein H8D22_09265 [Candidatus Cloacimonetes bacterium]|nr:hypothetical protein [Candidatus Cloacimonadota bacterium]